MIIFSQGIPLHSRLGNSLVWMSRAAYWSKSLNAEVYCPYAIEFFSEYLSPESVWSKKNEKCLSMFRDRFQVELTAENIQRCSRIMEEHYEKNNAIEPFSWKKIVTKNEKFGVNFISGEIDFGDPDVISFMLQSQLTICHEPFPFSVQKDRILRAGEDWHSIAPNRASYLTQENTILEHSNSLKKVGLHIRRGDYEFWEQGKHFYSDDYWINVLKDFNLNEYSIWIFSNELSEEFKERLVAEGAHISFGNANEDFIRLMCMDIIVGPPSTYSKMAYDIANNTLSKEVKLHFLKPLF